MLEINLQACTKAAQEQATQALIEQLKATLINNQEDAFDMWAQIRTLQKVLDSACKECEPQFNAAFREIAPIGKQWVIGEQVFCVTDKPDYNYADPRNDEQGLFRQKTQEIDENKATGKLLTKELNSIKERILYTHPHMTPTHNYTLVYKGTIDDIKG